MKRIFVGVLPFLFGLHLYGQAQAPQTASATSPGASAKGIEVRAVINLKQPGSQASGESRLYRRAQTMNQHVADLHAWKHAGRGVLRLEWTGQNKCLQSPGERLQCFFVIRFFDTAGQRVANFTTRPLENVEKLVESDARLRFMEFKLDEREMQQTARVEFSYSVGEK
jgi:hypothetical protein